MKVRYWGVRGSIPVPGPSTALSGGNTPCVSVEISDGSIIVLDGGTGLRNLGKHMMAREDVSSGRARATLLFTHRHWDHIQGLPFFEPAYVKGNLFDVHFPDLGSSSTPLDDNVVSLQHNAANFPVPYEQVRSSYRFHMARAGEAISVGAARVIPIRMNHADVTLGYVIFEPDTGACLAYLCDTAPWEGPLLGSGMAAEGRAADVARRYRGFVLAAASGADLVIHDTFFDESGYERRKDWGHSTPSQALALCRDAGAKRLHLFHFNPDLDDDAVARLEAESRAAARAGGGDIQVTAAREGLEVTLP